MAVCKKWSLRTLLEVILQNLFEIQKFWRMAFSIKEQCLEEEPMMECLSIRINRSVPIDIHENSIFLSDLRLFLFNFFSKDWSLFYVYIHFFMQNLLEELNYINLWLTHSSIRWSYQTLRTVEDIKQSKIMFRLMWQKKR